MAVRLRTGVPGRIRQEVVCIPGRLIVASLFRRGSLPGVRRRVGEGEEEAGEEEAGVDLGRFSSPDCGWEMITMMLKLGSGLGLDLLDALLDRRA